MSVEKTSQAGFKNLLPCGAFRCRHVMMWARLHILGLSSHHILTRGCTVVSAKRARTSRWLDFRRWIGATAESAMHCLMVPLVVWRLSITNPSSHACAWQNRCSLLRCVLWGSHLDWPKFLVLSYGHTRSLGPTVVRHCAEVSVFMRVGCFPCCATCARRSKDVRLFCVFTSCLHVFFLFSCFFWWRYFRGVCQNHVFVNVLLFKEQFPECNKFPERC